MLYAICPFSRTEHADRVAAMMRAQTVPIRLIVAENGGARFAAPAHHIIRLDAADAVAALNACLHYPRATDPDSAWFRVDDDDVYLPTYAEDVAIALANAEWSGIPDAVVRLRDGETVHLDDAGSHVCTGGTLAARVSASLDFPQVWPGEDAAWCESMMTAGKTFAARPSDTYTRIRHPGCSTAEIPDEIFRDLFG